MAEINNIIINDKIKFKSCQKCKKAKPATPEFYYRKKVNIDGLQYSCKECCNEYHKNYYNKNKIQINTWLKEYQKDNSEQIRVKKISYNDKNKEHLSKIKKLYKEKNKIETIKRNQAYKQESIRYRTKAIKDLKPYEKIRKSSCGKFAEIECAYCGRWIKPTNLQCQNRLNAINGNTRGEIRIYCNDNNDACKEACPTYGQLMYPKGFKHASSREVSPWIRQACFERDGYECKKCGVGIKDAQLHCHHITGVAHSPMEQNDISNTETLCKACHKALHKTPGCTNADYRCD